MTAPATSGRRLRKQSAQRR